MIYTKDTISFEPLPTHPRFINLTNQVFHRLTVLGYAGKQGHNQLWFCECKCGKIKPVTTSHLMANHTQSCGCWHVERCIQACQTHGESHKTSEHGIYQAARARCKNPKNKAYANYGGRGIEFNFTSYIEFLAEMGRKPTPDHMLERINNNKHYESGNVKWATRAEQSRNKRNNRWVTINGITKCAADWNTEMGHPKSLVHGRVTNGWCSECAVFQPLHGHCPHRIG